MTPRILTDRSRIETFQKCPRLRYWQYEYCAQGLDLDGSATALNIGSAVHAGVGEYLQGQLDRDSDTSPDLLPIALQAALATPEFAALEVQEDRDLVEALVRTWWFAGLPTLDGWVVLSVEREEAFDREVADPKSSVYFFDPKQINPLDLTDDKVGALIPVHDLDVIARVPRMQTVRLMTRSDWLASTSGLQSLNNAPVAPGVYNWNLKTWRTCDDRRVRSLDYDAQLSTELLGPEARLGQRLAGNVWQVLIKENHPLVWCWRSAKRGDIAHRFSWHCEASHMNTHKKNPDLCPGDKWHKLGDDYERVLVRDVYASQQAAFEKLMADSPAILHDFHRVLGPYSRRSDYEIDRWCRQNLVREARLADVRSLEPLGEEVLDEHFPQDTAHGNCLWPSECPALNFCWGAATPESFEWRVPNHQAEKDAVGTGNLGPIIGI